MLSRQAIQENGVYFYFNEEEFDGGYLHYAAECLATGFQQLKIPLFTNIFTESFELEDIYQTENHLYIFYLTQQSFTADVLTAIMEYPTENKVILCMSDINNDAVTPPDIPSFMTHENRFLKIQGSRIPWAFGLSEKILKLTENQIPIDHRQKILLRNFSPSLNQGVRSFLDLSLVPHLEKYFEIDRQISADHFTKLKNYFGCLAYGGNFKEDLMRNGFLAQQKSVQAFAQYATYLQEPVLTRWDSWRFWESLAAGCLTFHLDFDKYGFELPVVPVGWQHYIPIDLENIVGTVEQLMDRMTELPEIARQGMIWARQNYSPIAVAERFLDHINAIHESARQIPQ